MSVTTGRVEAGPSGLGFVRWIAGQTWRHAFVRPRGTETPQAHLAYQDARWFEVPEYDSVLITNAEGSGVTWHVRNPKSFRRMLRDAVKLNLTYRRRWRELRDQYREALPEITSAETWGKTLDDRD